MRRQEIGCFDAYRQLAARTLAREDMNAQGSALNVAMGLAGEAGEVVDTLKKHAWHGRPLDRDALAMELGDLLWYAAAACTVLEAGPREIPFRHIVNSGDRPDLAGEHRVVVARLALNLSAASWRLSEDLHAWALLGDRQTAALVTGRVRRLIVTISHVAHVCGWTVEEIAAANILKLRARWPDGFVAGAPQGDGDSGASSPAAPAPCPRCGETDCNDIHHPPAAPAAPGTFYGSKETPTDAGAASLHTPNGPRHAGVTHG